ncbi:hypothetical protein K440DRAFT_546925, partial [Wilcoxina mikolae CBS 423.85]
FTADFCQHLTTIWKTQKKMSTVFHQPNDGLAGKQNQIIEWYLQIFAVANEQ